MNKYGSFDVAEFIKKYNDSTNFQKQRITYSDHSIAMIERRLLESLEKDIQLDRELVYKRMVLKMYNQIFENT